MPTRSYSRLPPPVSTQQRDSLLQGLPALAYQDPFAPPSPGTPNALQNNDHAGGEGGDEDDSGVPLLRPGYSGPQVLQVPSPATADPRSAPPEYKSPMSWELANPDYGYSQYHARETLLSDSRVAGAEAVSSKPSPWPYSSGYFPSENIKYTPEPSSSSRKEVKSTLRKPRRRRGFFGNAWEAPQWRLLAIHFSFCALTYPCLLFFIAMSRDKSLFWTRVFVGAGCGVMGFALDLSLMALAEGIMEACSTSAYHELTLPNEVFIWL